jgi:hypothetical protein
MNLSWYDCSEDRIAASGSDPNIIRLSTTGLEEGDIIYMSGDIMGVQENPHEWSDDHTGMNDFDLVYLEDDPG